MQAAVHRRLDLGMGGNHKTTDAPSPGVVAYTVQSHRVLTNWLRGIIDYAFGLAQRYPPELYRRDRGG